MEISRSTNMKNKRNLHFFNKIVIFIILTWVHKCQNDENALIRTLENGKNVNISLDIRTHRLLAKHEYQNEMPTRELQYKASYNTDNYKLEKGKGKNNTFQQLKESRTNHVDDYLKCYRNRYSKKFGLKKLDCYYEKVLFGSFNKINKIVEHKKASKSKFISIICTKCGLPLLLLSSLPLLTFSIPDITVGKKHSEKVGMCTFTKDTSTQGKINFSKHEKCEYDDIKGPYLRYIILIILVVIVLYLIIYTYMKILKYDRIRAGILK
ncbi:hypothetical protein PVMG_06074 [Plasmodium vivax Mauritania I]|uniref:Variable surface protein n=1 Tax=Plasmodium vivax Mauritania I TaxID=1035515 RepID=A0A0J9T4Q1_PLAVI|nr:hypothetical protein PVMG_06074 [Plasmodium vivax Mauritania I]